MARTLFVRLDTLLKVGFPDGVGAVDEGGEHLEGTNNSASWAV